MSATITQILPCLDTQNILNDPRDILAYVIRYYTTAPKSVSDTTPNLMISLMDDISRYQNTPSTLISAVTTALQTVLGNYFPLPTSAVSVNVSTNDNGNGTYNLTIELAINTNNNNYTMGADVSVNSTGILQLKFHPTPALQLI